jgi:hypothetical protein
VVSFIRLLAPTLVQTAVKQQPCPIEFQQVLRPGHTPRRARKENPHLPFTSCSTVL